jgi:hypothetical protein
MINTGEYNSWMGAFKLKDALMEANDRQNPELAANRTQTASTMAGYYNASPIQRANMRIPLYTDINQVFSTDLIKDKKVVPTVPGDTEIGTVVEYKDEKKSEYGVIIEPPIFAKYKGAYVKPIDEKEADILEKNQKRKKIILNEKSLKNLAEEQSFLQNFFIKIKMHYEKVREIFLYFYLAIIIGGLIYILSLLMK